MTTIVLTCRSPITGRHHRLEFFEAPPYFGEEIYCRLCRDMSRVLIAPHEGRARCLDCPYDTRGHYGIGRARNRARHHARRYPDHRLRLFVGARVVATLTALTWDDASFSDEFAETG